MKFKPETKVNMYLKPVPIGKTLPISEWTWRNGKNKMLFPDEQKQADKLSNINKLQELLIQEEKTNPQDPTTVLNFLISEGLIKPSKCL